MKIGMIVAMDKELRQLRPLFPEDKVILQKSGIATVNAAIQAVEMIRQYKPDCIISSGCAGGNGDDINLQDVVVSSFGTDLPRCVLRQGHRRLHRLWTSARSACPLQG